VKAIAQAIFLGFDKLVGDDPGLVTQHTIQQLLAQCSTRQKIARTMIPKQELRTEYQVRDSGRQSLDTSLDAQTITKWLWEYCRVSWADGAQPFVRRARAAH